MMLHTIRAHALDIPFKLTFSHASDSRAAMQSLWVEARDGHGITGSGEGCPREYVTGETLAFTVDDSTQITLRGGFGQQDAAGSLADIQVGSVVTVVVTDGVAASISVRQATAAPDAATAPDETEAPAGN
jgi:hypothetical protein